jgi:D-glycero-D-manno-heptose 1,7-bisphosphate phosphatase
MRPAVFLDRDGTMIEERGYLTPSSQLVVYPWTTDAIRLLKRAGFAVVVVTNQGGIARGLYTCAFVEATHRRLGERFAAAGAMVDAWQYCPHHTEATIDAFRGPCRCRKPGPGMIEDAALGLGLDLARSWVIGDHWRDVQLAHATGGRGVLVRSGHGRGHEERWPADVAPAAAVCDNLIAAAAYILGPGSSG